MKPTKSGYGTSGQALVELALVLPLLVVLVLGICDFSRAIRINNAISNMSREGANLASRSTIDTQHIMNTLAHTAQPLSMQENGMMYITVVKGVGGSGKAEIQLQSGWEGSDIKGSIASKIGTVSSTAPHPEAQGIATLNLRDGDIATVVEVFYNYKSLFATNAATLTRQLYSRTIF